MLVQTLARARPRAPRKEPSPARWLVASAVACTAFAAGGLATGYAVHSPSDDALAHSRASLSASATVVERSFAPEQVRAEGTVALGEGRDVVVTPVGGQEAQVVTSHTKHPGQTVRSGEVLATVSGRPVIALQLPFELYRDLATGDSGPDVKAVQESLRAASLYDGPLDGTFTEDLARAVRRLHRSAGATDPTGTRTVLRRSEVTPISAPRATVVSLAPVGTRIDGSGGVLGRLRSGAARAVVRAGVDDKEHFRTGATVEVRGVFDQTSPTPARVASVSGFLEADDSSDLPGYDITLTFLHSKDLPFDDGDAISASPRSAERRVTGTAVPLVAVRQDSSGTYVVVAGAAPSPVRVRVEDSSDGWALVAPGALAVGQTVLIEGAS